MFVYLEANRYRKSWEVSLPELKEILDCDKVETYSAFKEFNKQVLKKAQTELHEKTECRYDYEPIRRGRFVVGIKFDVKTIEELYLDEVDKNQISVDEWLASKDEEKLTEIWEDALTEKGLEFTQEEIEELRSVLVCVPKARMPQVDACPDSIDISRYHYMSVKCATTVNRAKNKFAYLMKLLKTDAEIE